MPTTIYRLKDGTRVPSVTTILGVLAKPELIHWAWKTGKAGLDYQQIRAQAADIGTLVHQMILCDLRDIDLPLTDISEQDLAVASRCRAAYSWWKAAHTIEAQLLEEPLVSEVYRFGGTPDFYGLIDNKPTMVDFKTSGGIYGEHRHQVAAYATVLEEKGYPVEDILIVRVGKELDGQVEEQRVERRAAHFRVFLACQEIYNTQKELRG